MNDLPSRLEYMPLEHPAPTSFFTLLLNRLEAMEKRLEDCTHQISSNLSKVRQFDPSQGPVRQQSEPHDLSGAAIIMIERIEHTLGQLESARDHLKTIV